MESPLITEMTHCRPIPTAGAHLAHLICIGWLVVASAPCQSAVAETSGWIFDTKGGGNVVTGERPSALARDDSSMRRSVWREATRSGPLATRTWLRAAEGKGNDYARLTMLGAIGLSGGASSREWLARLSRTRTKTDSVFLCLAAGRPRVRFPTSRLLRFANESGRSEVERLAARVALLRRSEALTASQFLEGIRDKRLEDLLHCLFGALYPSKELAHTSLSLKQSAAPGSLAELELRASLLLAAVRPTLFRESNLEAVAKMARSSSVRALVSLAYGRKKRHGNTTDFEIVQLDRPSFLSGLETARPALQKELLDPGPPLSRSADWRSLWWAATAQLLAPELLGSFYEQLREAGKEGDAGMRLLVRRLLHEPGLRLGLSEKQRASTRYDIRRPQDRFRVLIGLLDGSSREAMPKSLEPVFGPRVTYAWELMRSERLGGPSRPAGELLWRELVADSEGYRSTVFRHVFLRELNLLIRELFGVGPRAKERRFLPKGIREVREAYFNVLEQLLEEFPMFES